ncbi:unnamed protein product [Symbiodinium pilosum]|uniref:Uncharacterized protein n=1 Tax=Symbiodinium pilosum TaxID=2952 RepID=A0A812TLT5_SYMPI|nr:unnamed protein product [Symbiodinium pilosum]
MGSSPVRALFGGERILPCGPATAARLRVLGGALWISQLLQPGKAEFAKDSSLCGSGSRRNPVEDIPRGFLVPAPSASGNPGCAPGRLYLCCQLGGTLGRP